MLVESMYIMNHYPSMANKLLHKSEIPSKESDAFKQIMQFKNRRRWKFESYQKGQRAVHKLAADVLNGSENKKD